MGKRQQQNHERQGRPGQGSAVVLPPAGGTQPAGRDCSARVTWRKRGIWRVATAVAVPLFLLVVLEGGLRLARYGYPTSYFVRWQDGDTLTANRRFGWQFMRREVATKPYPLLLPMAKPPGTQRVFIRANPPPRARQRRPSVSAAFWG